MTIHAPHARMLHPTAHETRELKILIPHLPIRKISVRLISDRQQIVIPKRIPWLEVPRDLPPTCMASRTILRVLIPIPLHQMRIFTLFPRIELLPVRMLLHRSMAGLTTHRALRHRRLITIRRLIIVLPHPRVVAGSTHLIPNHPPPGPMPPLPRLPILVPVNIKPFS